MKEKNVQSKEKIIYNIVVQSFVLLVILWVQPVIRYTETCDSPKKSGSRLATSAPPPPPATTMDGPWTRIREDAVAEQGADWWGRLSPASVAFSPLSTMWFIILPNTCRLMQQPQVCTSFYYIFHNFIRVSSMFHKCFADCFLICRCFKTVAPASPNVS